MTPDDAGAIVYALRVDSPALQAVAQRRTKALKDLETAEAISAHLESVKAHLDAKLIDLESAIRRHDPRAKLMATEASTYAETAVLLTRRLTGCVLAAEGCVRTIHNKGEGQ